MIILRQREYSSLFGYLFKTKKLKKQFEDEHTVAKSEKAGKKEHARPGTNDQTESKAFDRHQDGRDQDQRPQGELVAKLDHEQKERNFKHRTKRQQETELGCIDPYFLHIVRDKSAFKVHTNIEQKCKDQEHDISPVLEKFAKRNLVSLFSYGSSLRITRNHRQKNNGNHAKPVDPESVLYRNQYDEKCCADCKQDRADRTDPSIIQTKFITVANDQVFMEGAYRIAE